MWEIKVFDEDRELLEFIAEQLLAYSLRSDPVHIALSGGATPKALFQFIAKSDIRDAVEWKNLHFWWGDERMVPDSDADSNYGEAKRLLFDLTDIPAENLHPINGALALESELARIDEESQAALDTLHGWPSFDWVMLGVGEDGHTASLFPGQVDYNADTCWVPASHPETGQARISLSAEAIGHAQRVSYLVIGAQKAEIVVKVFADDDSADEYPAANIYSFEGDTEWLLDTNAAKLFMADEG